MLVNDWCPWWPPLRGPEVDVGALELTERMGEDDASLMGSGVSRTLAVAHFATFFVSVMPSRYHRYALAIKLRILDAARTGGDWQAVAEAIGVNINTARSWLRLLLYKLCCFANPSRGGKRAQKITADGLAFLMSKLAVDPDLTLRQLVDELERACSISVCA
ncbi:uncharacterized protein IUM83_19485 [Phytophthora cinnamomi]|uniref:uncharacterized protein n=1 Tax=Phytophthora cinnamomi TaxID=4785 RepID=UPI003559D5F7|nr:hypothetical protein IUM83_19485 [Phytophthora cinnamomi]